jgi:deoxyribodipyrimidine photo-lyase
MFSMNESQKPNAVPEDLARLSDNPRIQVRRSGPPGEGRAVVYWMQRAVRINDNPALDVAIEAGNLLGLPVVVYFSVIPNYPNANLRHYHFLGQALRDVAEDAAERGVGFVLRRHPESSLEKFLEEVDAALLVGDENPCREPERWRQVLARRLRIPYWTVDADVVVPSRIFGRDYFLLHHFRPHLHRELKLFLVAPPHPEPFHAWEQPHNLESYPVTADITAGFRQLDRSVGPVDTFRGGAHGAHERLREFVRDGLATYVERRGKPELDGTSRLSAYLHFGNISPITIALAARGAVAAGNAPAAAAEKFLDELIGWRELAVLFVRHNPEYDNWACAETWARRTLQEHAGDPRPFRYSFEELDQARTHDELWNAAQRQMVLTGWMHNFLRMYWAKKIAEWAPSAATAFEWAVILNDRYQIDGRDPNGYAGIAWSIVGKHDRPWFDRPIIGTVRAMTEGPSRRKFDAAGYIGRYPASGADEDKPRN